MEQGNLLSVVVRGGWLMVPILVCSIIALAVVIERFLTFRRFRTNIQGLMLRIRGSLARGDLEGAKQACEAGGAMADVLRAGLEAAPAGRDSAEAAMEGAGDRVVFALERNLGVLATVAAVAPLIGFLGTVTGMIRAFMEIQALGGNVNADVLAGGIWEAMVTTAGGLSVGIPALIFYNYFVGRVDRIRFEIESAANELLGLLGGKDAAAAG